MTPSTTRERSLTPPSSDDPFPLDWEVAESPVTARSTEPSGTSDTPPIQSSTHGLHTLDGYSSSVWVDARSASSPSIPPTAALRGTIPSSMDIDVWAESLLQAPPSAHLSETRLRASRDARLLLALRQIRQDQADQMRRLQDARGIADHLLRSTLIRQVSALQGADVRIRGKFERELPPHGARTWNADEDDGVDEEEDADADAARGRKRMRRTQDT